MKKGVQIRVIDDNKPHPDAENVEPTLEDAYLYYISKDKQSQIELEN